MKNTLNYMAEGFSDIIMELYGEMPNAETGIDENSLCAAEGALNETIPNALRSYYSITGNHPLNTAYNQLISPENLSKIDGQVCFMRENQGVCSWTYDADGDDPIVNQYMEGDFCAEGVRLFDFLKMTIYIQSVWGGFAMSADHIDSRSVLADIKDKWDLVVSHNGLNIWQRNQALISHIDGDDVCIGAANDLESLTVLSNMGFEEQ